MEDKGFPKIKNILGGLKGGSRKNCRTLKF